MIPIAQGCTAMAQDGKCSPVVWFGPYPKDGERVYTESEIRKWLAECSEKMWRIGMNAEGGTDDKYRAMIAAKLQELENAK